MYIVCDDDHLCDIVYHAYSWPLYSYVSWTTICICSMCRVVSLYYDDRVAGLPFGILHRSTSGMDLIIMYFGHRMTPPTSHIRGHLL